MVFTYNTILNRDVTIAASGTKSGAIDLGSQQVVGLFIPAAFTGTAITFEAAPTVDGTYVPVTKSDGTTFSLTAATSKYIGLDNVQPLAGVQFLKVVSGSTEGSARTLTLATRPLA